MKSNFTNLANTYMYGDKARMNFTKKYLNNDQSIDDPIFTGFTLSIDDLHSPLFFTSGIDASETLRSRLAGNSDVSKRIEEHLKEVYVYTKGTPSSYEITTHAIKDAIDNSGNYLAGYGLQDKIYMDNILYGAMDYIYMVDKDAESNLTDDEDGSITDIGDGTPNTSIYDSYNAVKERAINSSLDEIITTNKNANSGDSDGEDPTQLTEDERIQRALDNMGKQLTEKQAEHDANKSEAERLKNEYKTAIGDNSEYSKLKKQYEEIVKNDHVKDTTADFEKMQNDLKEAWEKYIEKPLDDGLLKDVENAYNSFAEKYLGGKTTDKEGHVIFHLEENNLKDLWEDIKVRFHTKDENGTDVPLKDFETCVSTIETTTNNVWNALKKKIKTITKSQKDLKEKDDIKTELDNEAKKLYGSDDQGNPLSEQNAAKGSLYMNYMEAENKVKTDAYSQIESEMNLLNEAIDKDNAEETQMYNDYQSTKTTTAMKPTKTVDITSPDGKTTVKQIEKTYNRGISEVPQTVYDILGFISGMKKLTSEYPYVLQSVTGLDEAYKTYFVNKGEPYQGSGDGKISINCYESLDLRVSSMFNKYFNAVYDRQYKRERVPINLRRFTCSIFVHDIRNFRDALSRMPDNNTRFKERELGDDAQSKIVEIALNSMSAVEFKFFDCEIVPEETGSIFDNVNNESIGDMRRTNFTFTYGNCVINFLPFEDLNRYYNDNGDDGTLKSDVKSEFGNISHEVQMDSTNEDKKLREKYIESTRIDTGDTRRWFDKSELGNVNNNDYRDYIRHDSSVAVDDYYKTTIVNNFAEGSLGRKNQEITRLDDALKRMVMGISASTGIPVKGVTDALDIKFIDPIINQRDEDVAVVRNLGNINNQTILSTKNSEFIGEIPGNKHPVPKTVNDLGNVNKK